MPEAGRDEADAAFLTGVFSFVDAVFGGSLESTLNVLTLSRPIQAGILHRQGVLGLLLSAVEALGRGAWDELEALSARLQPLKRSRCVASRPEPGPASGITAPRVWSGSRIED